MKAKDTWSAVLEGQGTRAALPLSENSRDCSRQVRGLLAENMEAEKQRNDVIVVPNECLCGDESFCVAARCAGCTEQSRRLVGSVFPAN